MVRRAVAEDSPAVAAVVRAVHVPARSRQRKAPELQPGGELAGVGWFTPGEIPEPHTNALRYALADAVAGRRDAELTGLRRE